MSADVLLQGRELSRRFPGGQGVDSVSLTVAPGMTVSLAGPNGSGKTTLLRLLAGLEQPDTGIVTLNTPKGSLAPAAAWGWWLGVVSQHSQPWPHLTVLENVRTPLVTVLKVTADEAEQQAVAALARFGLADRLAAMPGELSGGLKQRLVLARAAALRPQVLLLDEVTSALDPEWTHEVGVFIKDFCANGGAVVQVSHRMGQVQRLSDHVLFLHQGKVLASGHPEEVFHAAADPLIRLFLDTA